MASSLQRIGATSSFVGFKLLLRSRFSNHGQVIKLVKNPALSLECLAGIQTQSYSNAWGRLYSTTSGQMCSTEQTHFGATAWMMSNPSPGLYRLPLTAPPIIHQRLIIDYKIPPRLPTQKSEILDPVMEKTIEAPNNPSTSFEKRASKGRPGLVVIRRIKMNKHKLKKRRKKLKYLLLKIHTRRETRKEKEFLNGLMAQIREADKFDPKTYVANIIAKAKEKPPIIMYWKRNRLPDWLVKEKLAEEAAAEQREYLSILDKRDQDKLKE